MRGGAVAARRAHNPKVLGSNPSPATRLKPSPTSVKQGTGLFPSLIVGEGFYDLPGASGVPGLATAAVIGAGGAG